MTQPSNSCGTPCCNCCEGISQETPQWMQNRPGLNAIAYRVGAFQQFKDTLLARLQLSRQPFLAQLTARANDDFAIALLDSFAVVADVLTFYTERYQNEAYLLTAQERRSILDLAALIGYQLRPGVAASTYLAFTLDPSSGAFGTLVGPPAAGQVLAASPADIPISIGTKVQSVPGPGEKPQFFETVEAIQARVEWNAMTPLLQQQQDISNLPLTLVLNGAVSNVKSGDKILVLPDLNHPSPITESNLKAVVKVEVQPDGKSTYVHLEGWSERMTDPGYRPNKFVFPGADCLKGHPGDLPPGTPLDQSAVLAILKRSWDAQDLLALANIQKWPLDALSDALNEQFDTNHAAPPKLGAAFVMRQQVATFGHNAPFYKSLQPILRFPSKFATGNGSVQVAPAYPSNWENWTLGNQGNRHSVFLDSFYPGVVVGSWIVLQTTSDRKLVAAAAQVASNTEVAHTAMTLSSKVSLLRLRQAPTPALSQFRIRQTTVLCQSEPLGLGQAPIGDPIRGNSLPLDRIYVGLLAGRTVAVSGERYDLPGVTVAEIRTLDRVELICGLTVITLDRALDFIYKRSTVQINANLALATNGETVTETLGNGDGTQTFQSFPLRQSPLTYVSANTPSGTQSTLEVRVDGMLWEEVPFFYGHAPDEHIYITREDDNAVTKVTFGDGQTGSRLPTGMANVTAAYRRGIGTPGEVGANQLTVFASRPLGVRGVNNPLDATGAADPENLSDARQNATLTIRSLERIVSIDDYQDFARAFAGIAKAVASWSWDGQSRVVVLTVSGTNGEPVDAESDLAGNLLGAIANYSEPRTQVQLFPHQPRFFKIEGTVEVLPEFQVAEVAADLEATLRTEFSFHNRDFGQAVHRSEVIAAIQNVSGVKDVDLLAFYRSDQPRSLEIHIPAAMPRLGGTDFFGAELLTLDAGPLGLQETQ